MTDRIKVAAQTHATNVFSGYIRDELTDTQLITRDLIGRITYRRYRATRPLIGTGTVLSPLDAKDVELPETEYALYGTLQPGLEYSTSSKPYTFIWRVPDGREPFFPDAGTFFVEIKFHARDSDAVEKLTFEVTVT